MKITIVDSLPDSVLLAIMSNNVVYRPDLKLRNTTVLLDSLGRSGSDAIVSSTDFNMNKFTRWRPGLSKYVVRVCISPDLDQQQTTTDWLDDGFILVKIAATGLLKAYIEAFEVLERLALDQLPLTKLHRASELATKREVIMVGAGLVNLVTAYRLMENGWKVRVMDGAPEPSAETPWMSLGCSHGGDDARMFTLSEMDNYNDRAFSVTMNGFFNNDVTSLGWRACKPNSLTSEEESWISDYEVLPPWLANRYNQDIFSLSRDSKLNWERWHKREPDLFSSCETRQDILRIYSDPQHLRGAIDRQNRIGATIRVLSPEEVRAYEPGLSDAIDSGPISGGILVHGFTVNAHKFAAQLICRMKSKGSVFEWDKQLDRVVFDQKGDVQGLICGDEIISAENYVVSPGAYGGGLLQGTRCEGRIHGVLGAWIRLPNLEPRLLHSLKVARKGHVTEDANVTVATDASGAPIIIIGSGYGYTGVDPFNVDSGLLQKIYDGLVDTAKRFFPRSYEASHTAGSGTETPTGRMKYCVRPWTSTGLGLFEMRPTGAGGSFIVTGGHNTGGFAQSPTVADAVASGLEGTRHEMHRLYHPDRAMSFLGRCPTLTAEASSRSTRQ
jgi:D-amino-acid dehydrogenase